VCQKLPLVLTKLLVKSFCFSKPCTEVSVENIDSTKPDPIKIFLKWYEEAQTGTGGPFPKNWFLHGGLQYIRRFFSSVLPWSNLLRPDIATLATVARENSPSARSVLFKGLVHGGFSFFTDYESEKGKELAANPSAVLVFYWHLPPRQVRIDGKVIKLSREEAQADWKSRKLENQAASAATQQSSIIQGREELVEKVNQIKRRYKGKHIPCPDSWGGYCLIPEEIEFWQSRFDWIHHRERYVLNNGKWERLSLAP
jgi:pyridoxamine 5'-phosphate oxidase